MYYVINEEEFEKIRAGELKKEKVIKTSRIALITWTGEDNQLLLSRKKKQVSDHELSETIKNIKKALEWCDCAMCIENTLDYAVKEIEKQKNMG